MNEIKKQYENYIKDYKILPFWAIGRKEKILMQIAKIVYNYKKEKEEFLNFLKDEFKNPDNVFAIEGFIDYFPFNQKILLLINELDGDNEKTKMYLFNILKNENIDPVIHNMIESGKPKLSRYELY
jgi:hypothetical protein